MIKLKELVIIISSMVIMSAQMNAQNLGIGANVFTPDTSALVEMRGTKGLLIPRMTTTERDAITSPAQSLLIFNTDTKCFETNIDGQWQKIYCTCADLTVTAVASPSTINSGQSSTLTASGASTYLWSTGANTASITVSPTSTTTYTVTGTSSAGCTATATVTVTVNTFTCGTSTVTYDGVTYNTIQIGDQCWFKENLRTTKYNDGTSITKITSNATWASTTSDAYCCYSNDTSNCNTYGALYNCYAVNTGKLCPSGWHVPSDGEWKTLEMYLGMTQAQADATGWRGTDQGAKLAGNASLWIDGALEQNANFGTSGFSALPGGNRSYSDGSFNILGKYGDWWSSTETDGSNAWNRNLSYTNANVFRYNYNKSYGFSVRCLRD